MKQYLTLLIGIPFILFISGCKEAAVSTDPVDPGVAPRVIWVWMDSPKPMYRLDNKISISDTLPIGYTPGRLLVRFNKIMIGYTVTPNVRLAPEEEGFAQLSQYGRISIDGQTFEFPVYNYFKVGRAYTVIVGKEATDVTDRKLETDYRKTLTPEPHLRIAETYPEPGDTNVLSQNSFYFYFNSPIDTNSLQSAASISPNVPGRWAGSYNLNSVYFTPATGFNNGTWYIFTFSEGLKDTFNNFLTAPMRLQFKTARFEVTSTYPNNGQQNVNRSDYIYCTFTSPIDTGTVRSAFSIHPEINGYFDFTTYYLNQAVFRPYQNFLPETTYTVTVSTSLLSKTGDNLAAPYTFSFKTGL